MGTLPKEPFKLHGGCFCKAITYTISVPSLESRPLINRPLKDLIGPQNEVNERLPWIALDHCNTCRRISAAIVQAYLIIPLSWTQFTLLPRSVDPMAVPANAPHIEPTINEYLVPQKELLESTHVRHFSSSEGVHRTFCGNCGTQLSYYCSDVYEGCMRWGGHFDVFVGTLEKESVEMEGFYANRQGWTEFGIPWVKKLINEGVERFGI
jgi:hypothetical protein